LIQKVTDRPGHDRRYAMNTAKIRSELGWQPRHDLKTGLQATVDWYLAHPEWVESLHKQGDYHDWMQRNYANRGSKT
jgi:dTDP-glucose 4,6-dehydratase